MKNKFTKILIIISTVLGLISLAPAPVFAANDICSRTDIPEAVKADYGCTNATLEEDQFGNTLVNIMNAIILILGLVAVIVIIIGAVTLMTSNGDAGKVVKGKNTILYAVIGLIIAALSYGIVNFTINIVYKSNQSSSQEESNP
ncbi:hypothetical protein IKE83_01750 [Candidatus Saccharibacteria bacterium]|nr:hypothetical protein [Candidatus Saccharibacteria bacterium]